SVLRQDPDVIMVGEIRDSETAKLAAQAAMTGHLVLATLHTSSALGGITRLQNIGLPDYLISATVRAVLAQRLVRRRCLQCASTESCVDCGSTGYAGRTPIAELLDCRSGLEFENGRCLTSADQLGVNLREDAQNLVKHGITDSNEVNRVLGV
ncbi:MAG: ATPase, T2SS/T4P/T4SS family, partial [Pseudomonadota bacterium]